MDLSIETSTAATTEVVSFPSLPEEDGNAIIAQSCPVTGAISCAVFSESTQTSPRPLSNPNPNSGSFSSHGSHIKQRNSFRRNNNSPRPSENGSRNHGYQGMRRYDQECGNFHTGWNSGRYFFGIYPYIQPQNVLPGWPMPLVPVPFMPQSIPGGTYGGPFTIYPHPQTPNLPSYNPIPYPGSGRAFHLVSPPVAPPTFHTPPGIDLHKKIIRQINYYFSEGNLVKDVYLRKNMDEQGWVDIQLIANFKRMSQMTKDIQLIKTVMINSIIVEVNNDKLRRRGDWKRWILPLGAPTEFN